MKQIILAYLFVGLLCAAIFSVLSYGYGAGYVYLYWRDWQIQTNIWVLIICLALLSFTIQLIWLALKRYLNREQRKIETVFNFNQLHPYEQLAVIWLLNAGQDQQQFIQQVFSQSGLMKGIISSQLYWMRQQYAEALQALNEVSPMAFELAELQRIEIYLSMQEGEKALTHLEFLNQHELSPWLENVKSSYEQRLTALWGKFAQQFPWMYLRSTKYGHLGEQAKQNWLEQLLLVFDDANEDGLQALQQRYSDLSGQIELRPYDIKVLWLKVLSRLPEMGAAHQQLAEHLLEQQFNQDVFYLWFEQQVLRQSPDYAHAEDQINRWESKYPALPVLAFAKWHVFDATGRQNEAEALLLQYPDDVLMSYLRIKSILNGQEDLVQQLNLIFENNANFVKIKI
ncbi:heme biosynthesis protein HemY [Acinetobacter tianfuensis]|uniref:Heme biosynthesis protein HemY n=1 Tax=Acinetobacter tianfuensis TaxID=2419603 RepID=A0A3A8EHM0_9GAMM|nr:heme biosynthesis protein HemY [Acinetobacter tianfuensis]RKG29484.1 heme biosynthesis protein HemY [Acinetobacter tianfuensis]